MGCNFSRHVSEDGTVRADIDCTSINIVGIDRAIKAEHDVWHPPLIEKENGADAKIGMLHHYWREYGKYFKG